MKLAVYTVNTGRYDTVVAPVRENAQVDFLCFADRPSCVPAPWRALLTPRLGLGSRELSRFVKLHPHRLAELDGYDATLYIDGSIAIVGDVAEFASTHLSRPGDIFMFEHPFRSSLYAEAMSIAEHGQEWIWDLARQLRAYHGQGFPDDRGLLVGGVILRRSTRSWVPLMEEWWQEYLRRTKRDQLGLVYAAWRTGTPITSLGQADPFLAQQYFRVRRHRRSSRSARAPRMAANLALAACVGYPSLFGRPIPVGESRLVQRLVRRLKARL